MNAIRCLSAIIIVLAAACCRPVTGQFKQCAREKDCIDIRECAMFGPHFTEPAKWADNLKFEFGKRVCKRESVNGGNKFKVCCPSDSTNLGDSGGTSGRRGMDLLNTQDCGSISDDRIAHGKTAKLYMFPWMALLENNIGKFPCGATLIAERYVLTAAHCVRDENIVSVRLGEYDLNKTIDCDKGGQDCAQPVQDIPVERVIIHDNYSSRFKRNDIALIRLAEKASLNDNVKPICLPVGPLMRTTQKNYFVAGWGSTHNADYSSKLQFAILTLMPNDQCLQRLRLEDPYVKVEDSQMCAIGANLSDNCSGDSGGPLKTISQSAQFVQYGVVSFGLNTCGKKSAPGVYTRVDKYVDWILEHLEE
ncbi:serine protease grass-like [Anopheles darlingi]|uniref:limulus clotting factor C n=1 Tax=Anopheles darlingi TaxID=43151 RepID=A0A2M4CH75_ANODA|nr:serine protease grass-like [Anopheles darlingi]